MKLLFSVLFKYGGQGPLCNFKTADKLLIGFDTHDSQVALAVFCDKYWMEKGQSDEKLTPFSELCTH